MTTTDEVRNRYKPGTGQESNILAFPEDKPPYRAYQKPPTGDALLRLQIFAKTTCLMPAYSMLYDVVFSPFYDFVALVFPHMIIKMHGRNLRELVNGLQTHSIESITEYHPPFWEFVADEDDGTLPCIEEILIQQQREIDPHREVLARDEQNAANGAEHG